MSIDSEVAEKPLLRGHFHQAAFFFFTGACLMLMWGSSGTRTLVSVLIYSLSLIGLFGISALYHRPQWNQRCRIWMKRLDHSAIYLLIAGTGTPLFLLAVPPEIGRKLLVVVWLAAALGILQSMFWVHAPKWVSAMLYIGTGWLAAPYLRQIQAAVGSRGVALLLVGGVMYTLGAIVYALKRPDPRPRVFGYHEIFHVLVIVAAILHFIVIKGLVS